jgi:acyl-CoA synthetase (AMP-forming)/AMP-acid ligase II
MGGDAFLPGDSLWPLLENRVAATPDALFLVDAGSGRQLSYAAFRAEALALAAHLHQCRGLTPGCRVIWQFATGIPALLVSFALARLGVVQAPVIHLYRERELADILLQVKPRAVLVAGMGGDTDYLGLWQRVVASGGGAVPDIIALDAGHRQPLGSLPAPASASDATAWYYFTSGTTARPKGARHSDSSLLAAARHMGSRLGVGPGTVGSIGFPIAHVGGVLYCAMAAMAGIPVVLVPGSEPAAVVAAFNRYGVTLAGGSTAHYQMLLAEQRRHPEGRLIPSLRVLAGGGAAKPAALFPQVREALGATIVHAYGLTEAPISACNAIGDSDEQLTHSDGWLMPGLEVRISAADGTAAPAGVSGEICLRGPNVCQGYLDPAQTAEAFDGDGFFHTGDLGLVREDGHLVVTGRLKDIIIRKGENISAREIEELLSAHPRVRDVAVIGLPDETRGELVCAVVEPVDPAAPLTFAEMTAYLAGAGLMRQKIPERLEVMAAMPRNQTFHKVLKQELRRLFAP